VAEISDVNEATFDAEVLASDLPVLVDFWGDACPACRQIAPILAALAEEYAGRARILKVHATENPALSSRYGIRAMPTVLSFSGGTVCGQLQGARPKGDFVSLIEQAAGV
jgi:thioredoxin 1